MGDRTTILLLAIANHLCSMGNLKSWGKMVAMEAILLHLSECFSSWPYQQHHKEQAQACDHHLEHLDQCAVALVVKEEDYKEIPILNPGVGQMYWGQNQKYQC